MFRHDLAKGDSPRPSTYYADCIKLIHCAYKVGVLAMGAYWCRHGAGEWRGRGSWPHMYPCRTPCE